MISNLLIIIISLCIYRTSVQYQSNKPKCTDSPDGNGDVYKEIIDSESAYERMEFHPSLSVNEYSMVECSKKPIEADQACSIAGSKKCERVVMGENTVA